MTQGGVGVTGLDVTGPDSGEPHAEGGLVQGRSGYLMEVGHHPEGESSGAERLLLGGH